MMLRLARAFATTSLIVAAPAQAQDADNDGLAGTADPCPDDARNRCAGSIAIDTVTGLPIRINANTSGTECSGAKLDCAGDVWAGDFGFNTGSASRCNLGGGGEGCVINGISTLFGCDNEETEDLFQCERWDASASPELTYSFNVPNSRYIVNLFFSNGYTGTAAVGQRIFDIYVEGALKYDNFDQVAAAGGSGIAVVRAVDVNVTDGNGLQIEFVHQLENPSIKAIEVIAVEGCTSNSQCNDNNLCTTDTCLAGACQFTNNNVPCNDGLSCTSTDVCSNGSCSGVSNCPSGQTCNVQTGVCDAPNISFGKSLLQGETVTKPTSLQFGPDGRLYVAQQNGVIHVYTIARTAPVSYVVTNSQVINLVNALPNRNDDGSLSPTTTGRLVTGLVVAGTAQDPVIYIASGDPRIGGGSSGNDKNLDTNSGIISRLTWNGSAWQKLDLVRGLPRSEENHQGNGMYFDAAANKLFIAYGGNTNMGAPSNNFVGLPEYALSAAILSIDLAAIGNTTYDIPTLDDDDTTNVCTLPAQNFGLACSVDSNCDSTPGAGNGVCDTDFKDPFGGNNGKNQARIVPGGPVQVYAPGFRNPYDIVKTAAGRLYTIDNGPNSGWGDVPVGEGTGGTCTNAISEPGVTRRDGLHYISAPGYYGGHPNPTRANPANTFNASNPQSPVPAGNAIECDYRTPGTGNGALFTWGTSTNGLAEYTTSDFGGQLAGNLLTASFDDQIWRIQLNGSGSAASSVTALFSSVTGSYGGPLDVYVSKATDPFPGSLWVADHANSNIVVYEPTSSLACTGADDPGLDEDGDGFKNADEIDNGTDPCSSADIPGDWDGDFVSDINDPDDDNDSIPDTSDKFALDAENGTTTSLPLLLGWENDDPPYGGIRGLGFTGLMTNGSSDYLSLFDTNNMTAGGAAGVTTVDTAPEGDALGNLNTQQYGFQFGVDPSSGGSDTFTITTRIVGPFLGTTPEDFQSMGLFLGTGDQDNYFKVVTSANGGAGGVETLLEVSGVATAGPTLPLTLPGPEGVDLFLTVNRTASTVQAGYAVTHLGVTDPVTPIGSPVAIPASWLTNPSAGLAVGIIATSRGAAPPFPATWDFIQITNGGPTCTSNAECDDGNACTVDVCNGGTCTNDAAVDGTTCNDGLACTIGDICIDGACDGTDDCPLNQVCDAGTGACAAVSGDPDNDGLEDTSDPCPNDARNLCYGPVAVDQTTSNPIRINTNSSASECAGAKTDCNGGVWSGDTGFNTGASAVCNLNGGGEGCVISGIAEIFGCADEPTEDLFQCERYDPSEAPELQYSFNVPDGEYLVNLYLANTYTGTATGGSRVFDIQVEGATVYPDFDQIVAAGGSGIAVVRSAVTNVTDGNGLQIQFLHAVENPAIKAIEVLTATLACTVDAECNDGNVCNGVETCNPTVGCIAGTPLACNDGDACNGTETCNATTGCVAGTPPTCDDGNVCNGTETCSSATGCVPGTPLSCDDGNACNGAETCNAATGCAVGTPLDCNDGDACNGLESCLPASGCQAGIPLDCSDGDPCTTDSCSAGQCLHSGSCPPTGNIALDSASIRTACVGSAGDSITITGVPVGSQADRILVVTVGAEENNGDCNLGLASASATYGGLVMSKAVTGVSNTNSWRACNGIFYLLDPPTGTADVVIDFPAAAGTGNAAPIDNRHAGALVIYNAAQQAPEATATAGANNSTNPVNTAITPLTAGGVVVDVTTRGNTGSFTTTQAGQIEQWDLSCTSSSSATSIKPLASPGQTLLGWSHTNPNRYVHSLAAFAPSGVAVTTSTTSTTTTTNTTSTTAAPGTSTTTTTDATSTTTTTGTTTTTMVSSSGAEAFVTITPTGGINASTYNANSYNVRNDSTSGQSITQVRVEFADTLLPDLVFDPAGTAGDLAASCLSASSGAATTGFVTPANPCTTPYSVPYELGYRAIDLFFTDFDPGETFGFAADADPTSIRGTSGQGGDSTGSVSGLELTGATVTIWFDDGSQISGETFRIPGSLAGSQNVIKTGPPAAPTIAALNVATPATVASAAQTIRVGGSAGASVRLLRVQAELGLNGGTGYDLDPFEANSAVAVSETPATIGAGGFVDIPVTLTRTSDSSDLNYFAAVVVNSDGSGQTSAVSNVVVLEYVPPASGVQIDTASLRSACVGAAGDTISVPSVPVGSQGNRILVVTVGAEEDDGDCDLNLASATASYGGTLMSKAITRVSDTTTWRACNGIFYLLNPPTGTAEVTVNFPTATANQIDNRHAAAFVIFGAAQSAPEAFSTAGGDPGADPTSTPITPLTTGGLVVDIMTRGNTGTFVTTQAGQTERFDLSCTSSSSATSTKPVTAGGQSTSLGWDHSNPNRYAHSLAAFGPAP